MHQTLFGFRIGAIVRAMGKAGWSIDEAMKALESLNCPLKKTAVQAQLTGWTYRGEVPILTDKQWVILSIASGKAQ